MVRGHFYDVIKQHNSNKYIILQIFGYRMNIRLLLVQPLEICIIVTFRKGEWSLLAEMSSTVVVLHDRLYLDLMCNSWLYAWLIFSFFPPDHFELS